MSLRAEGCDATRAVVYTVYNLGGCVAVGLVRTAIAAWHLFDHIIINCFFVGLQRSNVEEKEKQGEGARKKTNKAFGNVTEAVKQRQGKRLAQEGLNMVEAMISEGAHHIEKATENWELGDEHDELTSMWCEELGRGILEIIWPIGSIYHTVTDNLGKKQVSVLGLDELEALRKRETQFGEWFVAELDD